MKTADSLSPSQVGGTRPRTPRMLWLLLALVVLATSCATSRQAAPQRSAESRDFTFFLLSDVHIGAENLKAKQPFTKADTLARARANVDKMRALVGRPYPTQSSLEGLDLGTVQPPRALIMLGDQTDGHKDPAEQKAQWRDFAGVFPAKGVPFQDRLVPVFACAGNHDGEPRGPQRSGLVERNRKFAKGGQLAAISSNGVHFALNWNGVHLISLNLCPADETDSATPFKYGKPGLGSWNDPQGALAFLKQYLSRHVGNSGEPIILMHHYGFDGFSMNDWYWWTSKQRHALYESLKGYNVAALFHGHDHHAAHYRWPDPKRHAGEIAAWAENKPGIGIERQYDVLSCGTVCWVVRVRGDKLIAAHYKGPDWNKGAEGVFVKSLKR